MADRLPRLLGCGISTLLFLFGGLPLFGILLLGERPCDIHIGPPCSLSWGAVKLITLAVIIAACGLVGALAFLLARAARRPQDEDDG